LRSIQADRDIWTVAAFGIIPLAVGIGYFLDWSFIPATPAYRAKPASATGGLPRFVGAARIDFSCSTIAHGVAFLVRYQHAGFGVIRRWKIVNDT